MRMCIIIGSDGSTGSNTLMVLTVLAILMILYKSCIISNVGITVGKQ